MPILSFSQNDSIVFNDGKIITGTITLDNGLYLFLTNKKGVNDPYDKDKIKYFVQNNKRYSADIQQGKNETTGKVFVNGTNINQLDISYCEIVGFDMGLVKSRIIINIDYGQSFSFGESMTVESVAGKPIFFNSMMDALNFMEKNGWQYVNQYAISTGNTNKVYRILLKKKAL